jgi:hypothetical protein
LPAAWRPPRRLAFAATSSLLVWDPVDTGYLCDPGSWFQSTGPTLVTYNGGADRYRPPSGLNCHGALHVNAYVDGTLWDSDAEWY